MFVVEEFNKFVYFVLYLNNRCFSSLNNTKILIYINFLYKLFILINK